MRREGYELAVSRPRVVVKEEAGQRLEPWEQLTVDIESTAQGAVMEALGARGADLVDMIPDGKGRVRLDYRIPSRGMIGFQTDFRTMTSGTGLMYHVFDHFGPVIERDLSERTAGVMISNGRGPVLAYALFNLQERGRLFVGPGDLVYEGQIVGESSRDGDMVVNPLKGKKLTNIRTQSKDENVLLTPPIRMALEQAMEYIGDDELVEVTPKSIRIRKRFLKEHERKKASREAA